MLAATWLDRSYCRVLVRRSPGQHRRWLVFLHGAGMDGHMFDAQLDAVPDGWGVCQWDARGHGRSDLDGPFRHADMLADLEALAEGLDGDVVLVGQSMGGNLAQSFAAGHPERAAALVLIDCTDNHGSLTPLAKLGVAATSPLLHALPWGWTVAASARGIGTRPETVTYARHALLATGKRRFREVMGFSGVLVPNPSYRLPCPTLLVLGAEDRLGNIRTAMPTLAAKNPRTTLVVIHGASHNSNQDDPDAFNTHLRAFLETIQG